MILKYPQLIKVGTIELSDHNRSALNVSYERIEKKQRMYDGTLRKFVMTDKRSFSVSWTMLPATSAFTVDNFAGADELEAHYLAQRGKFAVVLKYDNNPANNETFNCMYTAFSKEVSKRGITTFYDATLSFEEV